MDRRTARDMIRPEHWWNIPFRYADYVPLRLQFIFFSVLLIHCLLFFGFLDFLHVLDIRLLQFHVRSVQNSTETKMQQTKDRRTTNNCFNYILTIFILSLSLPEALFVCDGYMLLAILYWPDLAIDVSITPDG